MAASSGSVCRYTTSGFWRIGALAFGTGKGAHSGGIEQTHRHALLMQEPQQRLFITAAGLADHLHGAERSQAFQQLPVAAVGVRDRPRGVLGLDLQGILGDVDGDIVGRIGGHGCLLLVRGAHRLNRGSINCLRSSQAQRGGSLLGYELDSGRFSPTNDLSRAAVALRPERNSYLASLLSGYHSARRRAFRLLPPTSNDAHSRKEPKSRLTMPGILQVRRIEFDEKRARKPAVVC